MLAQNLFEDFLKRFEHQFPFEPGYDSQNEKLNLIVRGMVMVTIESAGTEPSEDYDDKLFTKPEQLLNWTEAFKVANSYQDAINYVVEKLKGEERDEALVDIDRNQKNELYSKFILIQRPTPLRPKRREAKDA